MRLAAALLVALAVPGCASRPPPTACRVVMADGMVWYGPTCAVAQARERWYADPSWRVPANIPALGYGAL